MSWKKIVFHLRGELRLGSTNQKNLCEICVICLRPSPLRSGCGQSVHTSISTADSRIKGNFDASALWRITAGIPGRRMLAWRAPMHDDLIQLLRHRQSVIADHDWRDRDAAGQLAALREVSEKISAWAETHQSQIDPRLRHYLANASLAKALAHCEESTGA
jgi:hypothetical protein